MGRRLDEPTHTATIAWLLDPKGEHGFGKALLESLLRFLDPQRQDTPFHVTNLEWERFHRLPGQATGGRTDVWIEGVWDDNQEPGTKRWLLVIEAKIGSRESIDQLRHYERAISRSAKPGCQVYRVFLTPEGSEPETARYRGKWECISFSDLAHILWNPSEGLKDKPGYNFLRYYIAGVFRDILNWPIGLDSVDRNPCTVLAFLRDIDKGNS